MESVLTSENINTTTNLCFHCGLPCIPPIVKDGKNFCCPGCVVVFEILSENNMQKCYKINDFPWANIY